LPDVPVDHHKYRFTGWMLLSKDKNVRTNAVLSGVKQNVVDENESGYMLEQEAPDYSANKINDENLRTQWVAPNNSDSLFVEIDLGKVMTVNAIQVNFQDFNATIFGKPDTLRQQFLIETSIDGKSWSTTVDYSNNQRDQPHAYIELPEAVQARFVKYRNVYYPNKYLAIGELRVFGHGNGKKPSVPGSFQVMRQADERNASVKWSAVEGAQGYVLYWGIAEDRLNNSIMIYDQNEYELRALNVGQPYFFRVEAFNENGISKGSKIVQN
ncbi:MAG: discoidin domain-containing protein, partial [Marinoscillum sp.]